MLYLLSVLQGPSIMSDSVVEQQIVERLETLMTSYAEDARAVGMLSAVREDVRNVISVIPKKLQNDLNTVLHLLVTAKSDNAEL